MRLLLLLLLHHTFFCGYVSVSLCVPVVFPLVYVRVRVLRSSLNSTLVSLNVFHATLRSCHDAHFKRRERTSRNDAPRERNVIFPNKMPRFRFVSCKQVAITRSLGVRLVVSTFNWTRTISVVTYSDIRKQL